MTAVTARLAVAEKARLCMGADSWRIPPFPGTDGGALTLSDGPHGLRKQAGPFPGPGLPATCFPAPSALASCWDTALVRQVGDAIGWEARAQEVDLVLGPGVNIKRSPLCGRNFEYFSEDPWLAGRLGRAVVEGIQAQGVGACVKHFAANNQETDRLRISADVDDRTLREIYLPAFEHIVTTARPWAVMSAYNKVNGTFASQHRWLLTDVLRDEWGFDGVVISDWGSVHDRVAALQAGLDIEMPPNAGISDRALVDAVASGALPESVLDQTIARLARLAGRAAGRRPLEPAAEASHSVARRAAAAGIVLLKNGADVLPVRDRRGLRVTVIGEFARRPCIQGAGSSEVTPLRVDVPLDELAAALPSADIRFAAGYPLRREGAGNDAAAARALADEAARAARDAGLVIVFLGLPPGAEVEHLDRQHIDLPSAQTDLVASLADAVAAPIVVVLFNGSVVRTSTWDHRVSAVLECGLGGEAVGGALADVLTGAVNPSGRLAETIPLRLQDVPSYLSYPGEEGHVRYGEGVFVGYRGYDATARPVAYPFGHGLSYTRFEYRDMRVKQATADGDDGLTATCVVTNAGMRAGHEVVQLYVRDPVARVARPPRELKGFTRIFLAPGASREVSFPLSARDLSYWSAAHQRWQLERGEFRVEIGASSRAIRLTGQATV